MADQYATQRPKRHGSPIFYSLLDEMAETHDKKSHDYAADGAPYGNYEFAGFVANLFAHSPDDAGFAGRIAEKMYRLSVLGKRGTQPLNESIDDTERDIAVIATLWMASRREKRLKSYDSPASAYREVAAMGGAGLYQEAAVPLKPFNTLTPFGEALETIKKLTLRDKISLIDSLLTSIISAANTKVQPGLPLTNSTGE